MNISICEAGAIFIKEVMCMTNYREILRLDSIGLNRTEIAVSCGCSRNTVAAALKRAAECGLHWPLPADMSDQQLAGILYPSVAGKPECAHHPECSGGVLWRESHLFPREAVRQGESVQHQ